MTHDEKVLFEGIRDNTNDINRNLRDIRLVTLIIAYSAMAAAILLAVIVWRIW